MATLNFKDALRQIKDYFDVKKPNNFYDTNVAAKGVDFITKAQKAVAKVPERPIQFKTVAPNAPAPVRFVANLPQTIVSETLNIPNRVVYNANKMGTAKTKNELYRGLAGSGSALLDIATLGVGSNLVKQGVKEAGENTFKEALKRLREEPLKATLQAMKTSQGMRIGAGSGSLQGVQNAIDENPNATMTDILKSAATTGVVGAGIGLVAEPALKYGSELTVKGAKKAINSYKSSPYASQKGTLDADELSGGIGRLLSGRSKAFDQELPDAKIGLKLDPDSAISMLKNPDEVNVAALQKVYGDISRSTMYKSFDPDTAAKALSFYTDTLGGDAITQAQKKIFGTRVMTPDLVRSFWKELKNQVVERTGKSYKQIEQEADDTLLAAVDDMIGSKTPDVVPQATVKAMLQPTMRNEADNIYKATKEVIDQLPPRANVTDQQTAQTVFEGGLGALKQSFKEIEDRATKFVSKEEFADMVDGTRPVDARVKDLFDTHQSLMDDLRLLTENPEIGQITGAYYPHATDKTTRLMDELFPGLWIDRANTLGGNLHNKRTGTLVDFDKDYSKVMGDYAEQVLYEKYRGVFKGSTPVIEEIVEHVKKAGDESMDYVTKLAPKETKGEVTFKTELNAPGGSIRTYENIFEKIGQEHKEFYSAFRALRDSVDIHRKQREEIVRLLGKPDSEKKVMNYLAEEVLGHKGDDKTKFFAQHYAAIQREGVQRFTEKVLGSDRHYRMQQFMEEASKYTYKSGTTKDTVNSFIDNVLKQESLEPAMLDGIANFVLKTFYRAHLGMNAKVGVLQLLEVNRIPATYGAKNFAEGLKRSVLDSKRLLKEYGFADVKPHYLVEDFNTKVKPTLSKRAGEILDNVLMKHIQVAEKWKNTVYAGAAEAQGQGKELGLTGKALYDHVRDSVYKNAHIADEFNTPTFMMNKEKMGGVVTKGTIARMAGQYGQFALKNLVGKVDAAQAGEVKKLIGLLMADVLNIAVVMQAFGAGRNAVETAFGQFFPSGLGPAFSIPFDILEAYQNNEEAKEQGYSTNYTEQQLKKLLIGSFVPAGAQINKTKGQMDTMLQGYKPTAGGLVAYPESGSAMENLYGLLFGANATPSGKQYGAEGQPYLRKNKSEVYKMLYQDDPEAARQYYRDNVEGTKQKGNTVENILNKGVKNTAIKTADDGSLILPTPSGNTYSVEELLMADAEKDKRNALITQIVGRKDQYEELPQGEKYTQMALDDAGVTSEDYKSWKIKRIDSQLTGKEKADAFMQVIRSGETSFTQLFKDGVLTKGEIEDLEKYGYINNAEELYEKLQMTDSYYIKKEMRKLKADTMTKLLKNQADTSKQLVRESAKHQIDLLKELAKVQNQTPKRLPRVNVSLSREKAGLNIKPKTYTPQLQKRVSL